MITWSVLKQEKELADKGNATIFNVAEAAGVSIKTVSRVMNREPNVRENTREKVQAAIKKLGYQPNTAARLLSGRRSYSIGLIYEVPEEFSYLGDVLGGAHQGCESEGYSLLLRPLSLPNDDIVSSIEHFINQTKVDGLLLPAPLADLPEVLKLLKKLSLPHAAISPRGESSKGISIHCRDEDASCKLTEFLIGQGHSKIAFIKGKQDHGASHKRYDGYCAALKAHNIKYRPAYVKQGHFDFESGKKAAKKLFSLDDPPTAIVASNDDMAAGVIFEARELGYDIPRDCSVVGFDDTRLAAHTWPPLTTVRQPIADMANQASRLLIKAVRGEKVPEAVPPFDCKLVIRGSTAEI